MVEGMKERSKTRFHLVLVIIGVPWTRGPQVPKRGC